MTDWLVTVQWAGDPSRIGALLSALVHIEPKLVARHAAVEVRVRSASSAAAKAYVRLVLERSQLEGAATAVAARAATGVGHR